jgi:hypothetical protein
MRFPADGGKGLSGAPKKKDKPVSTGTKRRSAAVASGSLIRKLFKEDHVQLPCTGSSPKLPAELANDKACWHGSEVLHADGGDGEHECPEERAPAQESKVVEEEPSTSASIHSLGAECGVNTPKGVRVIDSAWSDATPMQQSRGYTLVKSIMLEACKRVCPGDAQAMMDEILRDVEPPPSEEKLLRTVGNVQARLPKSSPQRAVLLAATCSSQTRSAAEKHTSPLGKK